MTATKSAVLSPCNTYRYVLRREWGTGRTLCWVMLNPSTADASKDDPTIRRCLRFSSDWGYRSLAVVNLFALRATNPKALRTHPDPVGPENDRHILGQAAGSKSVVVAWGDQADQYPQRAHEVLWALRRTGCEILCLGKTKFGHPRHPLYVPADAVPVQYP